jgi:hypothetical protein
MEKLLSMYFESSCYETEEFRIFSIKFKRLMKEMFKWDKIKFHKWHFYMWWFIKRNDKYVYFSIDDVRPYRDWRFLIRTAKNDKDYTWWANHFTDYINLKKHVDFLFDN